MRNPLTSKFLFILMSAVDVRMFYRLTMMDTASYDCAAGSSIDKVSILPIHNERSCRGRAPVDSAALAQFLGKVASDLSCRLELIEIWRIPPGTHSAEDNPRTAAHRYHLVLYGPQPVTIQVGAERLTAHQGEIFWIGRPDDTSILNDDSHHHIHVAFDLTREAE